MIPLWLTILAAVVAVCAETFVRLRAVDERGNLVPSLHEKAVMRRFQEASWRHDSQRAQRHRPF